MLQILGIAIIVGIAFGKYASHVFEQHELWKDYFRR